MYFFWQFVCRPSLIFGTLSLQILQHWRNLLVLWGKTLAALLYRTLYGLQCSVLCLLSFMTYILVLVGLSFVMYAFMKYPIMCCMLYMTYPMVCYIFPMLPTLQFAACSMTYPWYAVYRMIYPYYAVYCMTYPYCVHCMTIPMVCCVLYDLSIICCVLYNLPILCCVLYDLPILCCVLYDLPRHAVYCLTYPCCVLYDLTQWCAEAPGWRGSKMWSPWCCPRTPRGQELCTS